MNIFVLDADPAKAAQALCDQHLGKMLLESAQLLCNAHVGIPAHAAPYKPTHLKHPCSTWTAATYGNYMWLCHHARELGAEYEHRFGKKHASAVVAQWCMLHTPIGPSPMLIAPRTPFIQAMPEHYCGPDAVAAYRRYYTAEKMILRGKPVTWTRRERPVWLDGGAT